MKKSLLIGLGAVAVALTLGTMQASGQTVLFNFDFASSNEGWVNGGFDSSPAATVVTLGSQNYINIALGGYQVANVNSGTVSGAPAANFTSAMDAAWHNPANYELQYSYYFDTSTFTTSGTYLQLGSFVNSGTGTYAQTGTPSAYEPQFNGTQVASGSPFFGTVTVPFTAYGTDPNADTYYRLGLILNGDGTGVTVDYTGFKIIQVPEPVTLAMCGLGLLGGLLTLRRRRS